MDKNRIDFISSQSFDRTFLKATPSEWPHILLLECLSELPNVIDLRFF